MAITFILFNAFFIFFSLNTVQSHLLVNISYDQATLIKLLKPITDLMNGAPIPNDDYKELAEISDYVLQRAKDVFLNTSLFITNIVNQAVSYLPLNVSRACQNHFSNFLNENDRTKYSMFNKFSSLQLLDASGKPPSSLTMGNMFWLGDFDYCLNIKFLNESSKGEILVDAIGEYCLVQIHATAYQVPQFQHIYTSDFNFVDHFSIKWGMCFPSSCSFQDKQIILNNYIKDINIKINIAKSLCQTKITSKKSMDVITIIITIFLLIPVILVVMATICDCYRSKSRNYKTVLDVHTKEGDKNKQRELCHWFCHIFSARMAFLSLCMHRKDEPNGSLKFLFAIRFFLAAGVILVHTSLGLLIALPWKNQLFVLKLIKHPLVIFFSFSFYYMNLCFYLSGFFLSYIAFTEKRLFETRFPIIEIYTLRYIRLTVPYLYIIGFITGPLAYISKGPLWPAIQFLPEGCRKEWWKQILYSRNLIGDIEPEKCSIGLWYLSVDAQIFLLAVPLLWLLMKKPKAGVICILILTFASIISFGWMIANNNFQLYYSIAYLIYSGSAKERFFASVERRFWYRASNCGFGMISGYVIAQHKNHIKITRLISICGWTTVFVCVMMLKFYGEEYIDGKEVPISLQILYGTVGNFIWCAAISWIGIHCIYFPKSLLTSILCWKWFTPLGKLSFSMYLVHGTVLAWQAFRLHENVTLSINQFVNHSALTLVYCICAAAILYVFVESPINRIMRMYKIKLHNK